LTTDAQLQGKRDNRQSARSTCPYCGVGCQVDVHFQDETICRVEAPFDAAPNHGNLCVKGRFGLDFVHHPQRIRTPMIRDRRDGSLRSASWDEALDLVSTRLVEIIQQHGGDSVGAFASAKATNEDNYLFQKWIRAVLKTNNIDHCARLCHAGSVSGLQLSIGSSAMSNSIAEMEHLETFIVTGSNTTETHPVISLLLKKAVRQHGAQLIVIDPRQIEMTDFATLWLRQKPGTDVALFQAMANVICAENLFNQAYVAEHTEGFDAFRSANAAYTPEWAEAITSVPAEQIRQAARLYARSSAAAIFWGMGISQSVHGTENTLSLANLALLTGHIGRPYTGLNPLRGQNNVQGCSDCGGLPNVYTAYQRVDDPHVQAKFEDAWHTELSPEPGLTATEMFDAAHAGGPIRAMVLLGENPLMSEPNLNHAVAAIKSLDFLVSIDIFINETAEYADVILPAVSFAEKDGTFTNTDRRVQRIRSFLTPVGESRPDWAIIAAIAQRMEAQLGVPRSAGFAHRDSAEIWEEMRELTPDFAGITYERLESTGGLHWPCPAPDHPGTPILFTAGLPRGKGKLWPVAYENLSEIPDEAYPYHLTTGRVLFHWHGGTMTRRSALNRAFPYPVVEMHPQDAEIEGIETGDAVIITSRRGAVQCKVLVTGRSPVGTLFLPFHFAEAAANQLTNDIVDPRARIPDFKMAAVRLEKATGTFADNPADDPQHTAIKDPVHYRH
jgi:formate dehydrogenase alpha subunit